MDVAHAGDSDDPEPIDFYKLIFWPEPTRRPDAVRKVTSGSAKYWHETARKVAAS